MEVFDSDFLIIFEVLAVGELLILTNNKDGIFEYLALRASRHKRLVNCVLMNGSFNYLTGMGN